MLLFLYKMNIPDQFSALKQLLSQSGTPAGAALNQQTPASPSAQPNMVPPSVQPQGSPMPQAPMGGMPPAGGQPQPSAGLPVGNPEAQLILKSLAKRLDTIDKLELGQGGM